MATIRLTAAQALLRFLAAQHVERDGRRQRFFGGCFGIFGHGNVAGIGQALLQHPDLLPYHQARNEQAMVHTAAAYARMRNRLGTLVCTSSIGPGATNMVTGAALATINRLPVLLLPGDVFAGRGPDPVLQQLEVPWAGDVSVNDAFRPVSRYFDRIMRPEQVIPATLAALRVLTSPADTGAVTLAFPQDVQTEAFDCPEEFLAERTWHVPRRPRSPRRSRRSAAPGARSSSQGAASSTPRRPRRCWRSATRQGSPWARRRPARGRCPTTTRPTSVRSAPPARSPRTASRRPPTSSSGSARATAISPPPRRQPSRIPPCASST